jgi:hypothetical protein
MPLSQQSVAALAPKNGVLAWVNTGLSPCQFSTGAWHHMTYFLQRVTASGYQKGRGSAQSLGDTIPICASGPSPSTVTTM